MKLPVGRPDGPRWSYAPRMPPDRYREPLPAGCRKVEASWVRPSRAMVAAKGGLAPRCGMASSPLEGAGFKRRFEATHARRRYVVCVREEVDLVGTVWLEGQKLLDGVTLETEQTVHWFRGETDTILSSCQLYSDATYRTGCQATEHCKMWSPHG